MAAFPPAAVPAEIARLPFQIVTSCPDPPEGYGWLHEIKHDGHRLLAIVTGRELRLISRNGHDRTLLFRRRSTSWPPPGYRRWFSTARSPCPTRVASPITTY